MVMSKKYIRPCKCGNTDLAQGFPYTENWVYIVCDEC